MADENEFIMEVPDDSPVPQHGLGYEIFHRMKTRLSEIAEFIADTDKAITFGERLDAYTRVAINLRKLNLTPDDIVAVCAQNHEQTSLPLIAGLFNGNIVTCLEPSLLPKDRALLFGKVMPKILFVDEDVLSGIEETLKILKREIKIVVFGEKTNRYMSIDKFLSATKEEIEAFEPIKLNNNEKTAIIIFSSGSTGAPKGTCHSHTSIFLATGRFSIPVTFSSTTPAWISYSLLLIRCLREGGSRVLCRNFEMSQIWHIINKYKVTMLALSLYNVYLMVDQPINGIDISSLFMLACSGSAVPLSLHDKLKKLLPNVHIVQAYGLTEACGVVLVFDLAIAEHREYFKNKPDSCGKPIPGFKYKIVDPETEEILGPNMSGELRLKSKLIMQGYYNEDSSECFDTDGFFKTGDLMKYDEERCFYYIDRLKEIFKFRSHKWSPTTLENILISHPSVEMASVIGVRSARDGHLPMGFVKLRPNCKVGAEELVKYVDNLVDDYKRLRGGVKILDNLPMTATGKVHKRRLHDMI